MNRWLRRQLINQRKFALAILLLSCLVILASGTILLLIRAIEKAERQSIDNILQSEGAKLIQAISDEMNSIFLPHADALNSLEGELSKPEIRREKLDILLALPGAIGAVCLVDGKQLETTPGHPVTAWLADSLASLRGQFFGVRAEIRRSMLGRAKFRRYHQTGADCFLIADTYDRNGKRIDRIMGQPKFEAKDAVYTFAVLMDRQWVEQAVTKHMNRVIFIKDVFILSTFPKENGLGVVSGKDTVWWYGIRSIPKTAKHRTMTDWNWSGIGWFTYRSLYASIDESEQDDTGKLSLGAWLQRHSKQLRWYGVGFVAFMMLLGGAFLIVSATILRRQWVSQQTALEQLTHAMKTPIARMSINIESLLESRVQSPEQERSLAQSIQQECTRLNRAVQNAGLAITEGKLPLKRTRADLVPPLKEWLSAWQPLFSQQSVSLESNLVESAPGLFDLELLGIVFDNLLDNALRHTRLRRNGSPGIESKVTVALTRVSNSYLLQIDDTGQGIDPEKLRKLFQRFERGDRGLSDVSGLGIGLSIANEIVTGHGGSITAENLLHRGARFTVHLPG